MKCEICHKDEASAVLHLKRKDGSDDELFVCRKCSQEAQREADGPEGGEAAPKALQSLLNATLEFVEEIAKLGKDQLGASKCPACGCKFEDAIEKGLLKCPECWNAFAGGLRLRFLASQYGRRHVPGADEDLVRVERGIKDAVARQDFEKAAELKRELDRLRGAGGKGAE